jgi:hypothetical protein
MHSTSTVHHHHANRAIRFHLCILVCACVCVCVCVCIGNALAHINTHSKYIGDVRDWTYLPARQSGDTDVDDDDDVMMMTTVRARTVLIVHIAMVFERSLKRWKNKISCSSDDVVCVCVCPCITVYNNCIYNVGIAITGSIYPVIGWSMSLSLAKPHMKCNIFFWGTDRNINIIITLCKMLWPFY